MTPLPTSDQVFELIATPNAAELAFRVVVDKRDLNPARLPALGDAYVEADIPHKPRLADFSGYVHTWLTDGPPGYLYLYFAKDKTEAEKKVPFKEIPGSRHYDWPEVLHGVVFLLDRKNQIKDTRPAASNNRQTIYRPKVVARKVVTPQEFASCRTMERHYLSPTPFDIRSHIQPSPGYVEWSKQDARGSTQAMHGKLVLPADGTELLSGANAGTISGLAGVTNLRRYPATLMSDRRPFIIEDNQTQHESGVWHRVTVTLYPPPRSKRATF